MKKVIMTIAAALCALVICAAALANDTAVELYDKTADLLFNTSNVSLNVSAEFRLDGEWFKSAEATLKQDGNRSYRQLVLRAPKKDGTERTNGYTIQLDDYRLYVMEAFTPGIYRMGTAASRTSLLHNTVEMKQMVSLGSALISQADLLLGKDAVTRTEDGAYRIVLGEDAPAIVSAAMNQAVRFAAKRYFAVDYDFVDVDNNLSIYDYPTVTRAILYGMKNVSVRKTEITVRTDANGDLQNAEGTIGLDLEPSWGGIHQLDVTFRAEVSDRGSTMLKKFNPKDYNVSLSADWQAYEGDYGEEYSVMEGDI